MCLFWVLDCIALRFVIVIDFVFVVGLYCGCAKALLFILTLLVDCLVVYCGFVGVIACCLLCICLLGLLV